MIRNLRKADGFTLLEMIITIAVGSMITLAATTSLLLALRINAVSTETVRQQNTTDMLMHVAETIAHDGAITLTEDHTISSESGAKVEFKDHEILLNGTVFMEDVQEFDASMDETNRLLTIEFKTNDNTYTAKIYCRLGVADAE